MGSDEVKSILADATTQFGSPLDAFKKAFAGAGAPLGQMANDAKATPAGVIVRAGVLVNPLPVYTDTGSGQLYGPGSPYGSPDSQMAILAMKCQKNAPSAERCVVG